MLKAIGIPSCRIHSFVIDVGMEAMGREEENSYVVRKLEASRFNTHLSGPWSQLCVFISTVSAALPSGGTITVPKGPP